MAIKYIVSFTTDESDELTDLIRTMKTDLRSIFFAKALLLGEPPPEGQQWKNKAICKALGLGRARWKDSKNVLLKRGCLELWSVRL
ncbi:MAG: hypothetical protein LBV23_02825 [Deltaproteobacteria bacterium]|nr:hypothetical protein [Deltaproteobacteria bacterium]